MRPGLPCADSPHHITSIFIPVRGRNLEESGSLGTGLAVEPRFRMCLGGPSSGEKFTTITRVARLYGVNRSEGLEILAPLPPASGYAVSAAAAITSSLVLTAGRKTVTEALKIAHKAEIIEGTGLGDVLSISCGIGIVIRVKPGAPGIGEAVCLQIPGSVSILAVETGKMPTSQMLSSLGRDFTKLAWKYYNKIAEEQNLEAFIYWSESFSKESGLLSLALGERRLPRIPGLIGLYGKKRVIVFLVERDRLFDAVESLEKAGLRPRLLEPGSGPPRLWWA